VGCKVNAKRKLLFFPFLANMAQYGFLVDAVDLAGGNEQDAECISSDVWFG